MEKAIANEAPQIMAGLVISQSRDTFTIDPAYWFDSAVTRIETHPILTGLPSIAFDAACEAPH